MRQLRTSQVVLLVKSLPTKAGDTSSIPGSGDRLEEGRETHSSVLAWRVPWTEEPGGLQSMGSQRDITEVPKHTRTHMSQQTEVERKGRKEIEGSWLQRSTK